MDLKRPNLIERKDRIMPNQGRPRSEAYTTRSFRLTERLNKRIDKKLHRNNLKFSIYMRRLIVKDLKNKSKDVNNRFSQ